MTAAYDAGSSRQDSYKIANACIGGADENDLAEKFDRCTALLSFEFAD